MYGTTSMGAYGPNGGYGTVFALQLTGAAPVPEPFSLIFFGTGLVADGGYVSRRKVLRKA